MALKRYRLACALALCTPTGLLAQDLPQQSPRISSYVMDVDLVPSEKTVRGRQEITWRNATSSPTQELRFHLYLNAFRDGNSTFMREAGEYSQLRWQDGEFGSTTVGTIELVDGETVTPLEPQFVSPDDGNPYDATVLRVELPRPVAPGEVVTLRTEFESRMPKAYARTGWIPGGGFFCMHWYPILGVLEDDGQGGNRWNCHQFHAFTEFFADFSVYEVSITLPTRYQVGATGIERAMREEGELTTHEFVAEDVHNFAFVADPNFVRHQAVFAPVRAAEDPTGVCQAVAEELGVPVETFDLPEVQINLLLHPEHDTQDQVDRHLNAVQVALEFFGLRYGPYPYPAITVVDPGRDLLHGGLGGGMEYPTLITCGTSLFPHSRRMQPEGVTIHEFGHQYWYGLSANNEFEESWLDEGINTYSEGRAQWLGYFADRGLLQRGHPATRPAEVARFGLLSLAESRGPVSAIDGLGAVARLPVADVVGVLPASAGNAVAGALDDVRFEGQWIPDSPLLDLMRAQPAAAWYHGVPFQDVWADRNTMLATDNPDPMVRDGWEFIDRASYGTNSYQRPATVLRTLERMVGKPVWWTFMREFHARARFGHPTTGDFATLLEQRCGPAASGFFRHAVAAQAELDYGVHAVRQSEDGRGRRTAIIRRYGSMMAEVKVRFTFASGDVEHQTIAADDPETVFRFQFDDAPEQQRGRLVEVWVDPPELPENQEERAWPAGVYLLDENLLNNAWRLQADPAPALHRALRALLQTQCELSFTGLIG